MARLPRLNLPSIPQHVVQRGNNRQACFFAEQDYTVYLSKLKDAINKAWVLGDDRFKKQIEKQAGRRASPMVRGGDRKSEKYKADQLL